MRTTMSELRDALHRVTANGRYPNRDFVVLTEAARKYANIHPSRLHEWHILHIKPVSWGLTHPLDCDLTDCAYQTQAESWDDRPDEIGNYQWHAPASDWDWSLLDTSEEE